jgi:signal transduction histidine kinase
MPCDRFQLLHDYARLCIQLPGDSRLTAQNLLGHLSRSLNLAFAAYLLFDKSGTRFIRVYSTPSTPLAIREPKPLAESPWHALVDQSVPGKVGLEWICPVKGEHALHGLLVCGLHESFDFCEADASAAHAVGSSLSRLLGTQADPIKITDTAGIENAEHQLREFRLLYRVSRALHSTLKLDELTHLILSAAVLPGGAGFERAMLFTVNEKTGVLQGMLGVARDAAIETLNSGAEARLFEIPALDHNLIEAQRVSKLNRMVIKQRLPLTDKDNPLARAYLSRKVVLIPDPALQTGTSLDLAKALELGPYACAPLSGRDRALGVLLVDNPVSREKITPACLWFLELFASQAGAAFENARLVRRLEQAHEDLRETQERLIQGEKLAVLGEMAAQIAHELKNPLVSIGGFAQRLERRDLGDPRSNEYASIIAREVRRMEEMLGNILAFSKNQLVCLERCDLRDLLSEVHDLEREDLKRSGIELEQQVAKAIPVITGDCRMLRQVLLNLLINARQAMPHGGRIMVRIDRCMLHGAEGVVLEVEDTGGGIPSAVIRNIFNPFFSTNPKGTGLGLSISHRIVEHHHGELEVVNGEQGARFIVRLPIQPVEPVCR